MFFGLKKFYVIILCSIVLISTGAGTYIQFIKGDLFQAAIDNRVNELLLLITLFLVSVITELLFYYIEWKFENKLYSQFVNNTKKSISKSILSTNHFDTFDDTKNSAINILNNKIDRLEFQYYKSLFDNTYLFFKIILVSISLFYINILVAMVVFYDMDTATVNIIAMIDGVFLMVAFADYFITYLGKKSRFQPLDDTPSTGI